MFVCFRQFIIIIGLSVVFSCALISPRELIIIILKVLKKKKKVEKTGKYNDFFFWSSLFMLTSKCVSLQLRVLQLQNNLNQEMKRKTQLY